MKRNLEHDQTKKHFCSSGCADYSPALLVPGFGRMDGFLRKGACPCKTLQRDHCGREERPSTYPKELRCGGRRMADPKLSGDEIRDRIGQQAIHGSCDSSAGRQRQVEC